MAMVQLTPFQFTIWLLLMEIISAPVIAFTGAWIVNYYYSKKKEHDLDFLQRIVNVIEAAKVEWIDKPKKKE